MNYPDDIIHGVNHNPEHPNSPFYDGSDDDWIERRTTEITQQLLAGEYQYLGTGTPYNIGDVVEEEILDSERVKNIFMFQLEGLCQEEPFSSKSGAIVTGIVSLLKTAAEKKAKQFANDELAARDE